MTAAGCPAGEVSAWPDTATLRIVKGDPFAFRIVLRGADGQPADVSTWIWGGSVASGSVRVGWEWAADDTGVNLWLRGEATEYLSTLRPGRFDVSCMQPSAGEGTTVLAGDVLVMARTSPPLRNDPDAVPGREEEAIPA